jgi:uncharacterized membrane protein YebE (DUF533 family)
MLQTPERLTQLVRTALGRDRGEMGADAVDGGGLNLASVLPAAPLPEAVAKEPTEAEGSDPGVVAVLAEKVLLAWLRNRHQLLFPFALDLNRLDANQAGLLVDAMILAAQADGTFDGKERERIDGALGHVGAGVRAQTNLDEALERPKTLNEVLRNVHDVQSGALVYAASLMAVDHRKPVNRYYLKYLAARLQLSDELVDSLEQRFRSAG